MFIRLRPACVEGFLPITPMTLAATELSNPSSTGTVSCQPIRPFPYQRGVGPLQVIEGEPAAVRRALKAQPPRFCGIAGGDGISVTPS
jgi:hypothetical protein